MSANGFSAGSLENQLNNSMPVASHVALGTLLVQLIAAVNAALVDRARLSCAMLTSAGLAIHGAGSALAKANDFVALVAGVLVHSPAGDLPALTGTLATAKSAAWAFFIDGTGALSVSKTADVATHALAVEAVPAAPLNETLIGFVVVDNATGANFVGGATALDAANTTVTYYNVSGAAPIGAMTQTELGDIASR